MNERTWIGRRGERAAERHLKRSGLTILARNWRGGGGELDLAALEGDTLVFVEVKTRSTPRADKRRPVTIAQRRRIVAAARRFRSRFGVREHPYRFDLIEVDATTETLRWEKNYHRAGREPLQEER
ncbi:MAG: YraN family protein [Planctomycetota bacterium]|jgi:putative endonuclease